MTYSTTLTATQTFTIADARYLASRIASDLTIVRLVYGQPSEQRVQDYAVEAAMLLKFGLLESVRYGFQRDDSWVLVWDYSVNYLGQLVAGSDNPGGIYTAANVDGAAWHSFLTRRNNPALTSGERSEIEAELPIRRSGGNEPGSANGSWVSEKSYGRNGVTMTRSYFKANT